jgi:hypothetical protein
MATISLLEHRAEHRAAQENHPQRKEAAGTVKSVKTWTEEISRIKHVHLQGGAP